MLDQILVSLIFLLTVLSIFVNRDVVDWQILQFLDVPYYISPLIGASLAVLLGIIDLGQVYTGLIGMQFSGGKGFLNSSGPFSTLILFLSVAFVSLCLEVSGFFRYLAVRILQVVDGSGKKLFFAVFWISGLLALFTSNDILILTLTPFLIEFLDLADLDAVPYLVAEFFAANIFSMVLLIGNETNIIVATAHGLEFLGFAHLMFLPALAGGIACFGALYYIFRGRMDVFYSAEDLPSVDLDRWELLASSLLTATLLSLALLSTMGFLLWHVAAAWAAISFLVFVLPDIVEKCRSRADAEDLFLYRINRKMPWEVVPFLTGFFVLIQAFSATGLTSSMTDMLVSITGGGLFGTVFGVGLLSTLSANLLNNIPMTVLFSDVLTGYASGVQQLAALYSLVIGSNIGANITPVGALAGIMWMKMLNHGERRISFRQFFRIGWRATLITAVISFVMLWILLVT